MNGTLRTSSSGSYIMVLCMICTFVVQVTLTNYKYHSTKDLLDVEVQRNFQKPHGQNACRIEKVPHVLPLLATAQYLYHTNHSLIRYGDGEVNLIEGISIPLQTAVPYFSSLLKEAFDSHIPTLDIGIPDIFSYQPGMSTDNINFWFGSHSHLTMWYRNNCDTNRLYLAAHITSPYVTTYGTNCELLPLLYKTLRQIWLGKDVVIVRGNNGQKYIHDVYDTARSQTVYYAPRAEAWNSYNQIKQTLLKEDPSKLFLIAAGPISKALVYELALAGRRALDLGHLAKDYNLWSQSGSIENFFFTD